MGGQFEAFGAIEVETLKHFGLAADALVVDVGCGSGGLSRPLAGYLKGGYLGIDIVPELVDHARTITRRPDWRFETAAGLAIPEEDGAADLVCFFSVFTHLLQEESYVYLRDAVRVLRPRRARRVLVLRVRRGRPLGGLRRHGRLGRDRGPPAQHLPRPRCGGGVGRLTSGLEVVAVHRGDEPFIVLPEPLTLENGNRVEGTIAFGQSVAALRRPAGGLIVA